MRLSFCGAVSLLCAAAATNAPACRYNVREIGFVDVQQPEFRFAVFVHGDEQKDWLPVFQKSAGSILGPSNVKWEIVDETAGPAAADLALRGLLGPRLPGGVMTASGRGEGWPVFLHFPAPELDARLATLVNSPARTEVLNATIDTYGAVLLLRGQDEPANAAARTQAREAIQATEATLADLPKRIALGPRLVECDPSLPEEQALAWSLGVNGRDLARPVVAIVYGRGRLAGTPLKDGSLTAAKMKEQLAVIGADCECLMDHAWLTTGAIPLAVPAQAGARITQALGFDPDAAPVKAEVT